MSEAAQHDNAKPFDPDGLGGDLDDDPLPSTVDELETTLLQGPFRWRRRDVARNAGVSVLSARKLWRALGFASVDDDDVAFTDEDADALERTAGMVRAQLIDEETAIAFARALGQNTDRLVSWQVEALLEHMVNCSHPDCAAGSASGAVAHIGPILEDLEHLLLYTWRRKLAAAVRQIESPGEEPGALTADLSVGFVDLVSYTRLSQRITQHDLGVMVQRFEALASDVITAGMGRVIKTVGDEVLFTAPEPLDAVAIGLTLCEATTDDAVLPPVRVGISHGPVLRSLGDVYGSTVNMASRMTTLAEPGTIATDGYTAAMLTQFESLVLTPQPRRKVRGFGLVRPFLVARTDGRDDKLLIALD